MFLTWAFIDRSYSITYFGFSASKLICINWPFLLVSVSLKLLLVRASCRNLSLPPLSATILPPDWQTTSLLVTSQATTAYCLIQSFFATIFYVLVKEFSDLFLSQKKHTVQQLCWSLPLTLIMSGSTVTVGMVFL